jgi:uncharacterized damage-inducible protein DinB
MYDDPKLFVEYWKNVRQRTMRLLPLVPDADLEWTYAEGRFTFGDLYRHLAGIERGMYAETVEGRPSAYPGHGRELADGRGAIERYVGRAHEESVAIFSSLAPERLQGKCPTPAGTPITVWKWLRAMVEHEAHHRGQIYLMLAMRGVKTPPIYGMTEEEVRAASAGSGISSGAL